MRGGTASPGRSDVKLVWESGCRLGCGNRYAAILGR